MSAQGCRVQLFGEAGTGLCGWKTDGGMAWCAAHRRRRWLTGSFQADKPVIRKPSRDPAAMAARRAEESERLTAAIRRRHAQDAAYLAQVEARDRQTRTTRRITASLA